MTPSVLNVLTSRLVKALQPLNMLLMSVTFSVLKPLRSIEASFSQPLNIPEQLSNLTSSHIARLVSEEQPENMSVALR